MLSKFNKSRWPLILAGGLILVSLSVAVQAAVISGVIESAADGGKLTIRYISRTGSKTFRVPEGTEVRLDGRRIKVSELPKGARVSVFTTSRGDVSKVVARAPKMPVAGSIPDDMPMTPRPQKPVVNSPVAGKPGGNAATGWPHFNGPAGDNRSTETGLLTSWPENGPPVTWRITGLGEGYSSVSVQGDRIFTMGTKNGREMVIALNSRDGQTAWSVPTGGGVFGDGNGNGPRSTPTIDGDKLFVLGAQGDLLCLKIADGSKVWSTNILQQFQGSNITWGISESPLIDGENLICTPGGRAGTVVALNKTSGQVVWRSQVPGNPKAAYASPIVLEVGGVRQYAVFTSNGVVGVRARDGVAMWGDDGSSNGTANCSSPVAVGDRVFSASGYGKGGACVQLRSTRGATTANRIYHTPDMKNHHGGLVAVDGTVYGSSDPGVLVSLDAATGRVNWRDRSVGKGAITYADGHLYVRSEKGDVALVKATPAGYQEVGRFSQPNRSGRPAWPHPVVVDGRLYLRDWDSLIAFDVKEAR